MRPALVLALFAGLLSLPLGAGQAQQGAGRVATPRQQLGPPAGPAAAGTPQEQQIRQQMLQTLRRVLQLNDNQVMRLRGVRQAHDAAAQRLLQRERMTRQQVRQATAAGDTTNAARLIDELFRVQKDRIALAEAEQEQLKAFLTPLQRMQYLAFQERVDQALDNPVGGPPPPLGGAVPPAGRQLPAGQAQQRPIPRP